MDDARHPVDWAREPLPPGLLDAVRLFLLAPGYRVARREITTRALVDSLEDLAIRGLVTVDTAEQPGHVFGQAPGVVTLRLPLPGYIHRALKARQPGARPAGTNATATPRVPVTRKEVLTAFTADPTTPRTTTEVADNILRQRGGNRPGSTVADVSGRQVRPILDDLVTEGLLVKAIGGDVRMIARAPAHLYTNASYYVLAAQAAKFRERYLETLRRRKEAAETAGLLQLALGGRITSTQARNTMVEITLTPDQARALFDVGPPRADT